MEEKRIWILKQVQDDKCLEIIMDPRVKPEDDGIGKPLSFLRGGYLYWGSGNFDARGSYGDYWESQIHADTNARGLSFYSTTLRPQNNPTRGGGNSIRCVVKL